MSQKDNLLAHLDAMEQYMAESNDHLGLMTGANTTISTDMFDNDYVISGRVSDLKHGSTTSILYKGKDRKRALEVANNVILHIKRSLAQLEKEKKETFNFYD